MDSIIKQKLIEKYRKAKLHSSIGSYALKQNAVYKKQIRKKNYYIRRGLRAETQLTQLRSIPFLSKAC